MLEYSFRLDILKKKKFFNISKCMLNIIETRWLLPLLSGSPCANKALGMRLQCLCFDSAQPTRQSCLS